MRQCATRASHALLPARPAQGLAGVAQRASTQKNEGDAAMDSADAFFFTRVCAAAIATCRPACVQESAMRRACETSCDARARRNSTPNRRLLCGLVVTRSYCMHANTHLDATSSCRPSSPYHRDRRACACACVSSVPQPTSVPRSQPRSHALSFPRLIRNQTPSEIETLL
jgi:hypothetical protein